MFVEFESPNEDHHQAYFGVNDIEPFSDGNAWMIWFPGGDNRKVTGVTVRRVIAEGYKNTRDLIEMAKEAFYLDGANTAAYVELLDDDNSEQ